jgi:hypothetical protein
LQGTPPLACWRDSLCHTRDRSSLNRSLEHWGARRLAFCLPTIQACALLNPNAITLSTHCAHSCVMCVLHFCVTRCLLLRSATATSRRHWAEWRHALCFPTTETPHAVPEAVSCVSCNVCTAARCLLLRSATATSRRHWRWTLHPLGGRQTRSRCVQLTSLPGWQPMWRLAPCTTVWCGHTDRTSASTFPHMPTCQALQAACLAVCQPPACLDVYVPIAQNSHAQCLSCLLTHTPALHCVAPVAKSISLLRSLMPPPRVTCAACAMHWSTSWERQRRPYGQRQQSMRHSAGEAAAAVAACIRLLLLVGCGSAS